MNYRRCYGNNGLSTGFKSVITRLSPACFRPISYFIVSLTLNALAACYAALVREIGIVFLALYNYRVHVFRTYTGAYPGRLYSTVYLIASYFKPCNLEVPQITHITSPDQTQFTRYWPNETIILAYRLWCPYVKHASWLVRRHLCFPLRMRAPLPC